MTDDPNNMTILPAEQLRDAVDALRQTVTTLLEGEASLATFETAINSHDALLDQLHSMPHHTTRLSALNSLLH